MAKYIDKDKLIEYCKRQREGEWSKQVAPCSWYDAFGKFIDIITILFETPAADVQEVKHGKWILVKPRRKGRNATYKCTVCNQLYSSYYNDVQEWSHCPCGAKMDEKENDEWISKNKKNSS